jgi:NAD(P)-dependent dehydrogenase (short-subunit alcohol dehydrogenase family)
MQRFGAIDILVNNAGSVPSIQFADVDDAAWHEMLERKLFNYIRVTREVVPHMQKAGSGRIINIAGTAGWQPSSTAMAVGMNNAAVINWTKSMALQYAADGILVTAVAPGSIDTPRQTHNRRREADIKGLPVEELLQARAREIPLQRLGRPEEVAGVVIFLASKQASYITGSCVTVDGGVTRGI